MIKTSLEGLEYWCEPSSSMRDCLDEHVGGHDIAETVNHLENGIFYGLPDKMILDVDMLRAHGSFICG